VLFVALKKATTARKKGHALPGTIRDERGYTRVEGGQTEDDPHRFYGLEREKKVWILTITPLFLLRVRFWDTFGVPPRQGQQKRDSCDTIAAVKPM
jgi:hypothetical protein